MATAITLAAKGRYHTQPNPMVGCVIVDGHNTIIAKGYHQQYGQAHAEINALNDLKQLVCQPNRASLKMFITLEPCCYHGKTAACTNAIIQSGIKTVIIAMLDPNPKVSGQGVMVLEKNGIKVLVGVQAQSAQALNPAFIQAMQTSLPFITCKIGMSLDGKTAMANGQSKWITSLQARADVQKLRMGVDAIMTGVGTVLADNPNLSVRLEQLVSRPPIRIVLDSQARLNGHYQIFLSNTPNQPTTQHITKHNTPLNAQGQIDLPLLLAQLFNQGIRHILLEAGSILVGSMLKAQLINQFVIYTAPKLLGCSARDVIKLPIDSLDEAINLELTQVRLIGQDIKITAKPIYTQTNKPGFLVN